MGLDASVRVDRNDSEELWYGRKENEIHGWMQQQSCLSADDFNCVKFYLTKPILKQLLADTKAGKLTATSGFFFGNANDPEDVKTEVIALVKAARKALKQGEKPYYDSWW